MSEANVKTNEIGSKEMEKSQRTSFSSTTSFFWKIFHVKNLLESVDLM